MARPALPAVAAEPGAQQNFEKLTAELNTRDAAVTALAARVALLEARPAYSRGTSTVTVTNGVSNASASIAHGLGSSPTAIEATARRTADTRDDYICNIVSRDATNFVVGIRGGEAAAFPLGNPTTITFDWVAVA